MEFFDNLDPLLKTFWFIAIPVSLIFLIQTIMTFFGSDADALEADFDGDLQDVDSQFQLFSLRNLINFLLGFSWGGIAFYSSITNKPLLVSISFAIGIAFLFLFFLIIRQFQKLAESNTFKISNTLNKTAEVYLSIPGNKTGRGKIMISVNGTYHELPAMTELDKIPTGTMVKVVRIENENILIVEPIVN